MWHLWVLAKNGSSWEHWFISTSIKLMLIITTPLQVEVRENDKKSEEVDDEDEDAYMSGAGRGERMIKKMRNKPAFYWKLIPNHRFHAILTLYWVTFWHNITCWWLELICTSFLLTNFYLTLEWTVCCFRKKGNF